MLAAPGPTRGGWVGVGVGVGVGTVPDGGGGPVVVGEVVGV
ncbi:MAG: hypothetical protein QOE27_2501, partial [Solirubrobacteraceae bacterium]|nr:hypothetical protein [Solirubrobacteraceae bacterium]